MGRIAHRQLGKHTPTCLTADAVIDLPVPESWGILALQLLAVASFASLMKRSIGH